MKIIIVGAGKVGSSLAEHLTEKDNDITLVDSDREVLDIAMERYDILGIEGNGASMATLDTANIENADLLIAVTGEDEVNLLCCMTGHAMNENIHTIARVRNPEYNSSMSRLSKAFGISFAVNPDKATAKEIERLIRFPGFLKRDTFAKNRIEVVELKVPAGSILIGTELYRLSEKINANVLVCAVLRNRQVAIPDGSYTIEEGDKIFVTGSPTELGKMLKSLGVITKKSKKVLILGGGRLATYLAGLLVKSGVYVEIIERDREKCLNIAEKLPEVCVVNGDASNRNFLDSEGIANFDAVVTCTGMDELNIIFSIYSSKLGIPQIITKLGRGENESLLENLPVGSTVCPKDICTETIVRYVRAMYNGTGAALSVHTIADGKAEASEFLISRDTRHKGEPLRNLKLKKNILIASIVREGLIIIPDGNSFFNEGDDVIVVSCGDEIIKQFNDIFAS